MDDIQKKVFAVFRREHKKHLATIRGFLTDAKTGISASETRLDDLKRCAHTLKGAARAVGLDVVQESGAMLETLFSRIKHHAIELDNRCIDDLNSVVDKIEAYVAAYSNDPETSLPEDLIGILETCLSSEQDKKKALPEIPEPFVGMDETALEKSSSSVENSIRQKVLHAFQNEYRIHLEVIRRMVDEMDVGHAPSAEIINTVLRSAHTLKGAARAAELPVVQQIAHSIEAWFVNVRDGNTAVDTYGIKAIVQALDAVEDHVVSLNRPEGPIIPETAIEMMEKVSSTGSKKLETRVMTTREKETTSRVNMPADDTNTIRIDALRMDQIQRTAEQLMSEGLRHKQVALEIKDLKTMVSGIIKTTGRYRSAMERAGIPIKAHELSKLSAGIRTLDRQHRLACRMNETLNRQIQTDVQKSRMVAAEDVFQFFRKMMRDLASDQGKQVEFKVKGLEVLADRLVLQRLKDPLMHMLRNAVSHGIETPDKRRAAGKDPEGIIHFTMEIDTNRLKITIADDGNGLDVDTISDLAIKKGFASAETIKACTRQELLGYIYQPGFTTVKMITDLHGRGVGMSVVQESVNHLRGEIEVKSEPGKGTQFILFIPLTLSTHRILRVQAGGQTFGIPVQNIDRMKQIFPKDIGSMEGHPVITHNQHPLPFGFLSDLLDMGQLPALNDNDPMVMVLLRSGHKRIGLCVDRVLSEEEIMIKDLPPPADQIIFFAGGFVDANGSVCLILNPAELIDALGRSKGMQHSHGKEIVVHQKKQAEILIVDDSVTTRTLEKTILESQGYLVHLAVDGTDALDQLQHIDVDLVVTDIQMPQMDGFSLIEEMKKSDRLKEMPVIIVTSMADPQDMERGLNLGADAYIVKQKFDQKNLLEAIGQIL